MNKSNYLILILFFHICDCKYCDFNLGTNENNIIWLLIKILFSDPLEQ